MNEKGDVKHICGTCRHWTAGHLVVIGECQMEMEGTTRDHVCQIYLWLKKDEREEGLPA